MLATIYIYRIYCLLCQTVIQINIGSTYLKAKIYQSAKHCQLYLRVIIIIIIIIVICKAELLQHDTQYNYTLLRRARRCDPHFTTAGICLRHRHTTKHHLDVSLVGTDCI